MEAKLRQSDVALSMHKSQSFLSKVEGGEQKVDILDLLQLLALYKRSLSELEKRLRT